MESEGNKLFIGGVTHSTNEENLREYFSKYGEVKRAQVMRDRFTGLSRGFGFVSFSDQSSMERALQSEEHEILGRRVAVNIPKPIEKKPLRQFSLNHSNQNSSPLKINKIFVGGLPSSLTKGEFDSYFETFGRIIDSVIMYNKENKPRGFGFVTYDSDESVQKVLIDPFHQLSGKWAEVKRAIPRGEPQITLCNQTSWCYGPSSSDYLSYGYYYDMHANQMGASNAQYHGQQVWVINPNFAFYPFYYQNMPLGQPGNSYVDPMYVGNRVDGNGMQRDEGSSSSSNDVYGNGVDGNGMQRDEGSSSSSNDVYGNGIAESATKQEVEVVENGESSKPNDEISNVIVHADGVVEATISDCSLCESPRLSNMEHLECLPENEVSKFIVNGNGMEHLECLPENEIADKKAPSSEVVEHVETEPIALEDNGVRYKMVCTWNSHC